MNQSSGSSVQTEIFPPKKYKIVYKIYRKVFIWYFTERLIFWHLFLTLDFYVYRHDIMFCPVLGEIPLEGTYLQFLLPMISLLVRNSGVKSMRKRNEPLRKQTHYGKSIFPSTTKKIWEYLMNCLVGFLRLVKLISEEISKVKSCIQRTQFQITTVNNNHWGTDNPYYRTTATTHHYW